MGFFTKLLKPTRKSVRMGVTGNLKGAFDEQWKDKQTPTDATTAGAGGAMSFSPQVNTNPLRLGWTNGGYQYHNSPFNQQQPTMQIPQQPPPQTAMSFGGGLPPPQQSGTIPAAGAPPQGMPTATDPRIAMLRGGPNGGYNQ